MPLIKTLSQALKMDKEPVSYTHLLQPESGDPAGHDI